MAKKVAIVGYNPVLVDNLGNQTPINTTVFKTEDALEKAMLKGELTVPEGFTGIVALPVLNVVEVAEKPKAETKQGPAPKVPAAPTKPNEGEGSKQQ